MEWARVPLVALADILRCLLMGVWLRTGGATFSLIRILVEVLWHCWTLGSLSGCKPPAFGLWECKSLRCYSASPSMVGVALVETDLLVREQWREKSDQYTFRLTQVKHQRLCASFVRRVLQVRILSSALMPKQQKTKSGKKKYGPKMADPRFAKSKENRSCGPLGRYQRMRLHLEGPEKFAAPTMKPWTPGTSKIASSMVIHRKQRLQRTRKEVFDYFELDDIC